MASVLSRLHVLLQCIQIYWLQLPLQWRHNEHDSVSNHQPYDCLLNLWFRRRSRKTSKLRVTAFVRGIHRWPVNSPHKGPVTRKMLSFDGVIIKSHSSISGWWFLWGSISKQRLSFQVERLLSKDKIIVRRSYLYHRNSYNGKRTPLYWNAPLKSVDDWDHLIITQWIPAKICSTKRLE